MLKTFGKAICIWEQDAKNDENSERALKLKFWEKQSEIKSNPLLSEIKKYLVELSIYIECGIKYFNDNFEEEILKENKIVIEDSLTP